MSATKVLKLGTRRSMLATAQSVWVATEIEKLNPQIRVDLVGIETKGDVILDRPLSAMDGKEFFVAEIDEALKEKRVDLTVHSMKDLSLERPKDFVCAAIPRRENPRDVLLFGPGILEKAKARKTIRIGTSSPRRLENIPQFLEKAFPRFDGAGTRFEWLEIRGNVNTRLSRVHLSIEDPNHLDAVVLAFAGMIRLWNDPRGERGARPELQKLLQGVRWMVLPLLECPAAPAQGALAIECRSEDFETRRILASLHHAMSETQVASERTILAEWGGGCHQKLGATAIAAHEIGNILYVRGRKPDDALVEEIRWRKPPPPSSNAKIWDGTVFRATLAPEKILQEKPPITGGAAFIAHARAAQQADFSNCRVWTSGTASWFRLAAKGIWVEGSAENLGFKSLSPTLGEGVLQLPDFKDWSVFTHEKSFHGWEKEMPGAKVLATYQVETPSIFPNELYSADLVFWGSATQFDTLKDKAKKSVIHACGPGKTAARLRAAGVDALVFPSVEEWRKWITSSVSGD